MLNNQYIEEGELRALHRDAVQWAMHCAGFDHELARETVQQTYLKIVEGTAKFNRKSALKTWLFGVIRLTSLEIKRKQRLYLVADPQLIDEEVNRSIESGNEDFPDDYSKDQIEQAIKALSLMQREIIYLAFYKDQTLSEIAEILGVSVGTVRTQYHRSKIKLGNLLETGGDNGQLFETSYS